MKALSARRDEGVALVVLLRAAQLLIGCFLAFGKEGPILGAVVVLTYEVKA